jgi:hypothetical protein
MAGPDNPLNQIITVESEDQAEVLQVIMALLPETTTMSENPVRRRREWIFEMRKRVIDL